MLDKLLKKPLFFNTYLTLLLLLAFGVVVTDNQVYGAVFFGCIAALSLVLFSDLTVFLVPTMLLSVFVTVCYDSFDTFIKFIPLAIPLAFCIIFNLVKYKIKFKIGTSFWGIAAVAVAITLGGLGKIPVRDYFSPTSIYYVFMLGGGMLILYILFSSRMTEVSGDNLAKTMYAVGILATFIITFIYWKDWDVFIEGRKFIKFQASNNLSTFLMLAMPFPMYYARRRHFDILLTLYMYLCAVFSASRAGLVMGTIELFIILFAYTFFYEKYILKKLLHIGIMGLGIWSIYKFLPEVILKITNNSLMFAPDKPVFSQTVELAKRYFFAKNEPRLFLFKRAVEDFMSNLVFGTGLGYQGNYDLYSPTKGAMIWYHMWTAQVLGSMGLVGIAAYLYQLISRFVIYFKNASPLNMTFFMSYLGLFLMSQVNPGEFCPIPYGLVAVVYFIIIERKANEDTKTLPCI